MYFYFHYTVILAESGTFANKYQFTPCTFYTDPDEDEKTASDLGREAKGDRMRQRERKREDDGEERGRAGTTHCAQNMISIIHKLT